MIAKFRRTINNSGKVYQNCVTFPIINECYTRSQMLGVIAVWDSIKKIEKVGETGFRAFNTSGIENFCNSYNITELQLDKFQLNRGDLITSNIFERYGLEDVRYMDQIIVKYKYVEEYIDGIYKVSTKVKDGKKIFHLNPTDNPPDSLFIELVEENFHTDTCWEKPDAGEYIINEITSGGGSHSQFILVGFFPFKTRLTKFVDTYKKRNGNWKVNFEITSEGIVPYQGAISKEEIENI